jgi:hypothetical protein
MSFGHPEQRPLNMNHIERISCCSSLDLERNFDPNGCKRALGLKNNQKKNQLAKIIHQEINE